MKVKDMFTNEWYDKYGDIDVYQDCLDIDGVAYCGEKLTEEGKKEWGDVLDLGVYINNPPSIDYGYPEAVVEVDDLPNCEHLAKRVMELFWACAGYCTEDEWDKWFKGVE